MKNPQVMLKAQGRRFRVVIVGDTYQGPKRGILYVPGQPRKGLVRAEALQLASRLTAEKILSLAGGRVGSHVRPHVRAALVKTDGLASARGGNTFERPSRTPSVQEVPAQADQIGDVGEAALLITQRREALRTIAEIDARLARFIDPRSVQAIQRGMATALNGHGLSIQ